MLEIGLTGGIGSGKSTVAEMLVSRGVELVDADLVVRQVQAAGSPVVAAMAERFGDHIVDENGELDRAAVAAIVFSDEDQLKALNAIVHPAVHEEMTRQREAFVETDATVLLDIPLLIESNYVGLGGIIVVDTPLDVAVERLMAFRGFTEEDAWNRINSQVSREERARDASIVIDNSGDLVHLAGEVDRCWEWIQSLPRPPIGTPIASIRARSDPEAAEDEAETPTADAADS